MTRGTLMTVLRGAGALQPWGRRLAALVAGLLCVALGVAAQSTPPRPSLVNGTVVSLQGRMLQIDTAAHGQLAVTLAPQLRVVDQEPGSLADVKAGRFIGTTAVQGKDGRLYAREIHVFPESMRGAGEGHYPMGAPSTTMTNGNVEAVTGSVTQSTGAGADAGAGRLVLRISYKGGQSRVEVPPNVAVTMMRIGTRALLRPGASVTVVAQPAAAGLSADTVIVHARAPGG